ncbi:hypothetical protein GCM10022280_09940 [Sphingomonas swuensis]|uniref:histidine kinase n=1 Tax=Sphingomonas swuensis TaxID=977800 RepID=A0ABP7SN69_9SPHN
MLIAAAALVPLLLFAIFQIGYSSREQRRVLEAQALSASTAVILRADGEVMRLTTVLDALGTSAVLERGELDALAQRVVKFTQLHPDITGFEVRDRSGRVLLRQGVTDGERLRSIGPVNDRAIFAGFANGGGCRCLLFERSGEIRGQPVALTLFSRSETFARLLPPRSEYDVSALAGPQARFIARSLGHEERFSTLSSTYVQQAVRSGKASDLYRGQTLEGLENYSAFTRSRLTGWSAHLALGSAYLDNPARRFFASLGVAALLSLVLAGLLIWFAVRQMMDARRFAERMQQAQKMEALGQLTGGLAHDFNNLLTPVIGTLDQLQRRDGLDERGRRLAAGALTSAQRAARLTQQLLAFSRRQRLAIGAVDVTRLLADVRELIQRTLGARNRFEIEADPVAPCILTDRTQIELALLNLAINARDASPEGSPITLRVEADGHGREGEEVIRFSMIDRGSGMSEETRRRALEPFFTTKPTGQGTGLGLPQVFAVVEQSGGTVEIASKEGEGTVVTLALRACAEPEKAAARAEASELAAPGTSKTLRLLVVDDDPEVRGTIARMLSEAGHAVDAVANGTSALAALAAEKFDLIVTDYLMPLMSGAELIEEARRVRPGVPFLIVTGFSDTEQLRRACLDTATLAKPFTADELMEAIASSLKASRQED